MIAEIDQIDKHFTFKGVDIPPLTYAHRALVLSIVNLGNPTFMDIAGAIYGSTRTREEVQAGRRKPIEWENKVLKWIDKVKFSPADMEEANNLIQTMLMETQDNAVEPDRGIDLELAPDPEGNE